ncbi:hypothetical protein PoB_006721700 [Plakobranchus ocellatus]|uniref:Uncharacterized protein n=1 Tax=Plakobranchus ocellatus TaxID=259542 RepID=A0AAV4D8Y9_9GAST|nr:hypothetical protein PoB_006721700 [Plakobranchus ocellatus]
MVNPLEVDPVKMSSDTDVENELGTPAQKERQDDGDQHLDNLKERHPTHIIIDLAVNGKFHKGTSITTQGIIRTL